MIRAAIVENQLVVNIIDATPEFAAEIGAVQAPPNVMIGWTYKNRKFSPPETVADLDEVKHGALIAIDRDAEKSRLKFITDGAGQAMTYIEKAAEAKRYIDSEGQGDYLFLPLEVGVTGSDLTEVANTILNKYTEWQTVGASIERIRLTAKRDVLAASSVETVRLILGNIEFP